MLPTGSTADPPELRTLGVEEELMLVDPRSGCLVPAGSAIVAAAGTSQEVDARAWPGPVIKPEFFREQVESATRPCASLEELDADVRAGRRLLKGAADSLGVAAVAMPTPVVAQDRGVVSPGDRYEDIVEAYGRVAHESLISAMHVHVGVVDDEEGVAVLDRVRPWIPLLVALSANSPFWRGVDTAYASWRWQAWRRWPSTGPAEPFGDAAAYHDVSRRILGTGAAQDLALLNYEVRLSARHPTVEFRVTDVCTDVEDVVVIAAVVRALVHTVAAAWRRGVAVPPWRSDVLRSASWRAARWGVSHALVDPVSGELVAAADAVAGLVEQTHDALEAAADLDRVRAGLERILATGSGAVRQRHVHAVTGDLAAVVTDLSRRTHPP